MTMLTKSLKLLTILSLLGFWAFVLNPTPLFAGTEISTKSPIQRGLLLPGEHIILGTIQDVESGVIQVNIGQLEPLFLSLRVAVEKGITSIRPGDKLEIVKSDQDQVVDFHKADAPGWDRAIKGHLLQPLLGDHHWAVIQTENGSNETYQVKEEARHTVMNIPVGAPAIFLINKDNILIDATFGDEGALIDTLDRWSKERQRVVHY